MTVILRCGARLGAASALALALAGCGSVDSWSSSRLLSVVTPYKVDVVQGNFVSREQVQALRPGMGRQQVREILGTPLMTSLFHADRWEYVFTLKRPGVDAQTRRLTVFFNGDRFERSEGDEMPGEAEFIASLGPKREQPKIPPLQASDAQLARYSKADAPPPAAASTTAGSAAPPANYPPLESTR